MQERGLLNLGDYFTNKYFKDSDESSQHIEANLLGFPLPQSADTFQQFQESNDGLLFRQGCYRLLIEVLNFINVDHEYYTACIQYFMKEHICRDGTDIDYNKTDLVLFRQGMISLGLFVSLLKSNTIPFDARHDISKNLLIDMMVCGPGALTNIVSNLLALQAYLTLPLEFKQFRTRIAHSIVLDHIRQARLAVSPGWEIHYANIVVNHYAESLGVDKVDDAFTLSCDEEIVKSLKHAFKHKLPNALKASAQIDAIIDGLFVEKFVSDLIKLAKAEARAPYNDAVNQFLCNLKRYGVDEFNINQLVFMSDDLMSIEGLSYSGTISLFLAIAEGLEKLGYLVSQTYTNISTHYPLEMWVVPGLSLRFASIVKGVERYHFMPYFLEKLLENNEDWVHIYRAVYPVKIFVEELDVYVARFLSTEDYRRHELQDKEILLLDFLHLRGVERWHDISDLLPEDYARLHLARLLKLHLAPVLIEDIIDYYFTISKRHDSILVEYFLGLYTFEDLKDDTGATLLHDICGANLYNGALIDELINRGFDVNATDEQGATPLMYACHAGADNSVAMFLSHGANVDARTSKGFTALHYACIGCNISVVQMLLLADANCNFFSKHGLLPLHQACFMGDAAIVALLLNRDSMLMDLVAKDGNSPLSIAIKQNHWPVVKLLLEKGASTKFLQKPVVFSLINMLEMQGYPELSVPVIKNLVVDYFECIQRKLSIVRSTDPEELDEARVKANIVWNERRFYRSSKAHSVQRLIKMLDNEPWEPVDEGKRVLDKTFWNLALMTSKRMTLFVDTYLALQKQGKVADPEPAFDLNLHIM